MASCYLTVDGLKALEEEAGTLFDRRQQAESCPFRGRTKYVMQGILPESSILKYGLA
jgi:hypothetical protein